MRAFALRALLTTVATAVADEKKSGGCKLSADEQAVFDQTNAERKKAGLAELKACPELFAAARGHSANMARLAVLAHDLDGKTFVDRITAAGYKFAAAGENVAWNHPTPKEAVDGWMLSPGHRANVLNPAFTEIGVAVATSAAGERYWTQVFAAPLSR